MPTTASLQRWSNLAHDRQAIATFVTKVWTARGRLGDKPAQHLELHPCARESSENLLARNVGRHSLLDDNPCSG